MTDGGMWFTFLLENGLGVAIRAVEEDGRLKVRDVFVNGPHVTHELLQSVPIDRFEETLNKLGSEDREGSRVFDGDSPPLGETHVIFERLRADRPVPGEFMITPWRGQRVKVTRPGSMSPDQFYRNVALAYQGYAAVTKAAAARIAEEAGVPVTTAHRWVREARRRGFLPAGQKGRTG